MSDLTGREIGRYHIVQRLGEGGMAVVYRAYDTRLEREVAIKFIRMDQIPPAMLENMLKRFEREAKALARLKHPNIISVFDYGEFENAPYLVMDYMPGGTLKAQVGTPMNTATALSLVLPIADALAYAHEQGIVHRDIKPANILMTQRGTPMLSDFGIAHLLDSGDAHTLTGTGVGIGTPEYMAPEQWEGKAGPEVDIYALGVVLYELVTGRTPFKADTPMAVMIKQIKDPLPRPSMFSPEVPDDLERVLFKVLAKDPAERYPDMNSFIAALTALQQSAATLQAPIKPSFPQPQADPFQTVVSAPNRPAPPPQADPFQTVASTPDRPMPLPPPPPPPPSPAKPAGKGLPVWLWAGGAIIVIILCVLAALVGLGAVGQGPLAALFYQAAEPVPTAAPLPPIDQPTPAPLQPTPAPRLPTPTHINPDKNTPLPVKPTKPVSNEADCYKPEVYCVGLVTSVGGIKDSSFNQDTWNGLLRAEKDLGAVIRFIESKDAADFGKNIDALAALKYDMIVTMGYTMIDATSAAAKKYTDIHFVGVDQEVREKLPNLVSLVFPEDQAGFLVGALAAQMSKTGMIGSVLGPESVPPVKRFGEGYMAGAKYINPKIQVLLVYYGGELDKSFVDPEWGRAAAIDLIGKGCDVIFGAGGMTGNGAVLGAAEKGVMVIGVDVDQYYTLPEARKMLLTSAMKLLGNGTFQLIKMDMAGKFPPGGYFGGTAGIAPYHDMEASVPQNVKDMMVKLAAMLASGELKTGVKY